MEDTILVLTNVPDRAAAMMIASSLVERRLAACVNVLAECASVYRWEGRIETTTEVPVLVKTRSDLYEAVEAAIRELHPHELPEIVAVPLSNGLSAYFEWVAAETRPDF